MARLERDRPSIRPEDKFSLNEILHSLRSPHVLAVFVMFFMIGTNLYGLALFLPSIVNQMGFDPDKTQLLSVGPFAAGFFGMRLQRPIGVLSLLDNKKSYFTLCSLVRSLSITRYSECSSGEPLRNWICHLLRQVSVIIFDSLNVLTY